MNGEDSVSEEFGEELSESSKDFLRGCAPRIPPTGPPATAAADQPPPDEVIEAAGEAVRRYEGAMQSVVKGGYRPSAEELAWVEYRRSLVEGVSPQARAARGCWGGGGHAAWYAFGDTAWGNGCGGLEAAMWSIAMRGSACMHANACMRTGS